MDDSSTYFPCKGFADTESTYERDALRVQLQRLREVNDRLKQQVLGRTELEHLRIETQRLIDNNKRLQHNVDHQWRPTSGKRK